MLPIRPNRPAQQGAGDVSWPVLFTPTDAGEEPRCDQTPTGLGSMQRKKKKKKKKGGCFFSQHAYNAHKDKKQQLDGETKGNWGNLDSCDRQLAKYTNSLIVLKCFMSNWWNF